MKKCIYYLLISILILIFVNSDFASNSSSPILMSDTFSADGISLGNNTVMQRNRVDFILENPALLASLNSWNLNLNYMPGVFDTTYINGNIAYALPFLTFGPCLYNFFCPKF